MNRLACLLVTPAIAVLVAACGAEEGAAPAAQGGRPDTTAAPLGPKPGPGRLAPTRTNPYADEPDALADGRRLFIWFNCYGCHGGRAGGGMGPSLRDAAWLYGSSEQAIFDSIAEGRPHGMPAWGTVLPQSEIWKLTAYIKSMGSAREPDPPPPNPVYADPPPRRDVQGVQAGPEDQ